MSIEFKMSLKRFTFHLDDEVRAKLEKKAKAENRSLAFIINGILRKDTERKK